jgi:UDP-N-acetylglucosamine/UDP-N-acetylgalactosamine diphosphorylase
MPDEAALRTAAIAAGQGRLFRFWDRLDDAQKQSLLASVQSIDFARIGDWSERYVHNAPDFSPSGKIEPAPYYPIDHDGSDRPWDRQRYREAGEALLRAGKVAAFTVAGGQGTRLGFDGPKGCYPAGAVTGKPLFACLAEWVLAAGERYRTRIPWCVMTSPLNHDETVDYFEKHAHFGLDARDVTFFQQGVMPSFDLRDGGLLLADKDEVASNPDGHGGSLRALYESGAIDMLRSRGVEHICYAQVDNPLVRFIDPVFIGLHATAPDSSGEMSSKMLAKTEPAEKVGVFAQIDGKLQVIEYSDLPADLANERREDGSLVFNAGNPAIHMLGVDFVASLNERESGFALPFHRAVKKVAYVDLDSGARVEPVEPNAVKLETFVFDALPFCESSIVLEVDRVEEFAPIKNAEGADSPASCARLQTERAARWLEAAGVVVPRIDGGDPDCVLELSPRTAMWAEDLKERKIQVRIDRGARLAL